VSKKPIKSEKNNLKNRTVKKNRLNFKKTDRFGFGFISLKPKKPNRTQIEKNKKKTSQTGKTQSQNDSNRKKPSQIGLNWFLSKKPNRNRSV